MEIFFEWFSHTRVNGGVPVDELFVGDLVLGLDGVALITGNDLVELIAVFGNAGLCGGLATVSRRGSSRSGSSCSRDVDADVVVSPDVGTL